jgi:hypothetical protein
MINISKRRYAMRKEVREKSKKKVKKESTEKVLERITKINRAELKVIPKQKTNNRVFRKASV